MHDDAIRAAVRAMVPNRIQGFGYGTEGSSVKADPPMFVIIDVWSGQELWRGPALSKEDREAFDDRYEIEQMRLGIEAYLAASNHPEHT
jgi:hypothetical protein